jgi:hypothetical protein
MAFLLENVVPWGRNLNEYKKMFKLTDEDLSKKIIGFGDGPASFNFEASRLGYNVTSLDPIYQFTKTELEKRIKDTKDIVMEQMKKNVDNYLWTEIKNLHELEQVRMSAMKTFIEDYDKGKNDSRYIYHELPNKTQFNENSFDIGLSSHFLLMYPGLGYDFHVKSINEMLRVSREIRIFPIVDLDGKRSELTNKIIEHFAKDYDVKIVSTSYEFQKGGNLMLHIKK